MVVFFEKNSSSFISKINKQKRLNFAKKYVNKAEDFWKRVIFLDESKFNIFGSDGCHKIWKKANKEMDLKNVRPTVKHGGESIIVWGCMEASGNLVIIEGILDKYKYCICKY